MESSPLSFTSPVDPDTLRFIPLGGCGEFGMNLTAMLWRGRLFVIDCGVRFPDPAKLGIDAMLPDVSPWFKEAGGVFAYVITHGHEDHIGAIPYVIRRWPAPIYATPWTAALLKAKFLKWDIDPKAHPVTVVEAGDKLSLAGELTIEYVHVNHSLPSTCALYIKTPRFKVFHTGDFKLDPQPLIEAPFAEDRLAAIGTEGVDLLLADSTNADKSGRCPGEGTVLSPLAETFEKAPKAVIVTTFSSNLWRLKTIADACIATGRKLFIAGAGVESTLGHAKNLGFYHLPESLRLAETNLKTFPREKTVALASGCQAEWRSAMYRISVGEHRDVSIQADDTVVLSSRFIPGNERPIFDMMDRLKRLGARVISPRDAPGIHVSGHAHGGDIEKLMGLLKPKHFAPVHGAFTQLDANRRIGARLGIKSLLIETGDVIEAGPAGVKLVGRIDTGINYVDADAGVVLPVEAVRERLRVGELGAAIFSGVYSKAQKTFLAPPSFDLVGVRLPDHVNPDTFQIAATAGALAILNAQTNGKPAPSFDELSEEVRISLRRRLAAVLNKKPVVFVKLHLV